MRSVLLFILLCISPTLGAQTLTGRVTSSSGEAVEYVSVGLQGYPVGTVSDADGFFSLSVPDSLREKPLIFSHISYEPLTTIATELPEIVVLTERVFEIPPVVIRPGKGRLVNLNNRGIRLPGLSVTYIGWGLGTIGQMIDLPHKSHIREMQVDLTKNSYDRVVFRLALYRVEPATTETLQFTPLVPEPLYIRPEKSGDRQRFTWDLSLYGIETEGTVYACVELVEKSGDGAIGFPAYGDSSKWFVRLQEASQYPIGIGILLRGNRVNTSH